MEKQGSKSIDTAATKILFPAEIKETNQNFNLYLNALTDIYKDSRRIAVKYQSYIKIWL